MIDGAGMIKGLVERIFMSKKKTKSAPAGQKPSHTPTIKNKKATFNFDLLEKLEVGIALVGTEVKSLREGKATLEDAYARLQQGELYLIGCDIKPYSFGNMMNHEPKRPRKLLAHRREIKKLEVKLVQKGLTLVPVKIYFTRGKAKLELALGRGKGTADKRDVIKKRDQDREMQRAMKKYR